MPEIAVHAAPWDTAGLPSRPPGERCRWHDGNCAYRDDDPNRCTLCHASTESGKCTCDRGPLSLTDTDAIRLQYAGGCTPAEIAKSNEVNYGQVLRILKGVHSRTKATA